MQATLRLDDTLAAGSRFWVRGRFLGQAASAPSTEAKSWWPGKKSQNGAIAAAPTVALQTRIAGLTLSSDVPLAPDGTFEACLQGALPPTRRGWRIARNSIGWDKETFEHCNLVVLPPVDARAAIIVLMPESFTNQAPCIEQLVENDRCSGLCARLKNLQKGPGSFPVYYVGCVTRELMNRQAEIALTATSLGWPVGQFILFNCGHEEVGQKLSLAIERLRWLFAGCLDLIVVNLEPAATSLPVELREPPEEWAVIRRLVPPDCAPSGVDDTGSTHTGRVLASRMRPTRSVLVPRHPVVFCHGMLAFSLLRLQLPVEVNCFAPLRDFFRQRGIPVLFPQVPPTSGVEERASVLRDLIGHWTDEPVNLVAHSMGGLDARFMTAHLGMAKQVRSLTTVSTPHRGTYLADWFCSNFRNRVPLLLALEALGVNVNGFRDCGLAACRQLSDKTPDDPRVKYFSFGGEISPARLSPVLRRAWSILYAAEGQNDGMVSAASAHWGEYLGTIHADHFAQTPDGVFVRPGEDFDALGFYSRMVEDLARRGF
jgi:pimeloyl-ACP methyl ester carboxylesterase